MVDGWLTAVKSSRAASADSAARTRARLAVVTQKNAGKREAKRALSYADEPPDPTPEEIREGLADWLATEARREKKAGVPLPRRKVNTKARELLILVGRLSEVSDEDQAAVTVAKHALTYLTDDWMLDHKSGVAVRRDVPTAKLMRKACDTLERASENRLRARIVDKVKWWLRSREDAERLREWLGAIDARFATLTADHLRAAERMAERSDASAIKLAAFLAHRAGVETGRESAVGEKYKKAVRRFRIQR